MRLIDADALKMRDISPEAWYSPMWGLEQIDIDDAPTVEIPKWIPCEERLPEESGEYLITLGYEEEFHCVELSWFYTKYQTWSHKNANVIAWMPIPEFKRGE